MIGRFIGAAFIIPGLYFASRGYMTQRVKKQVFGITCLLGFQVNISSIMLSLIEDGANVRADRALWDGIWSNLVFHKH